MGRTCVPSSWLWSVNNGSSRWSSIFLFRLLHVKKIPQMCCRRRPTFPNSQSALVNVSKIAPTPCVCMRVCNFTMLAAGRDLHHLKNALAENRKDLTFQFWSGDATLLNHFNALCNIFLPRSVATVAAAGSKSLWSILPYSDCVISIIQTDLLPGRIVLMMSQTCVSAVHTPGMTHLVYWFRSAAAPPWPPPRRCPAASRLHCSLRPHWRPGWSDTWCREKKTNITYDNYLGVLTIDYGTHR